MKMSKEDEKLFNKSLADILYPDIKAGQVREKKVYVEKIILHLAKQDPKFGKY